MIDYNNDKKVFEEYIKNGCISEQEEKKSSNITSDKEIFEEYIKNTSISPNMKYHSLIKKDTHINQSVRRNKSKYMKKLDLHGYRVLEAEKLLDRFIINAYNNNISPILVVHGKGRHSENNKSTLKSAVISNLSKSRYVRKYISPKEKIGGDGTKLIFLYKKSNR